MLQTLSRPNTQIEVVTRLDTNPVAVYLAGLSKGSRPTMRGALNLIAGILSNGKNTDALAMDWASVRFQHTAAIRSRLAETYSPAYARKIIVALRGVLRSCFKLGLISAEDYTRAIDTGKIIGSTLPAGRALTADEIAKLIEVCQKDKTAAGARDVAIIALLRAGGLRRAEICSLNVDDYNLETGELVIRGKRNKERIAYVTNGAADALADWLVVRGIEPGSLFVPVNRGGKIVIRKMFSEAIFNMLQKRGLEAGVADLSPHDFRRTFVSDLLDAGADIATVKELAGHANIATTARYDRRGEKAKKKAIELLTVPYHRKVA